MCEEIKNIEPVSEGMISAQNIVNRSNSLLASIEAPLSVGAFKLFDTYLSLINPKDSSQTEVVIRKADYARLLNFKRVKTEVINKFAKELASLQFGIGQEGTKARTYVNLFECVSVFPDNITGEINIGMKCSELAKPLLFNLQTVGYIKYQLQNTLALDTDYEVRLYIYLLSQLYRKNWEISFTDLKKRLFCEKVKQYQTFAEFNRKILKSAVNHINEKTNITVEYKYIFQRGKGAGSGKIKFAVIAYDNMVFSNSLQEKSQPLENPEYPKILDEFKKICNNEFTTEQLQCLYDLMQKIDTDWMKEQYSDEVEKAYTQYFTEQYHKLLARNPQNKYAYIKKMIETQDISSSSQSTVRSNAGNMQCNPSYDIEELEKRTFLDI